MFNNVNRNYTYIVIHWYFCKINVTSTFLILSMYIYMFCIAFKNVHLPCFMTGKTINSTLLAASSSQRKQREISHFFLRGE